MATMSNDPDAVRRLMSMLAGAQPLWLIGAGLRSGLFAALSAQRPTPLTGLAARLGASPERLGRLVRSLAALDLLRLEDDGIWLTALGACLGPGADPTLRGHAAMACDPAVWAAWGALPDALNSTAPAFDLAHQLPFFDYLSAHPALDRAFADAGRAPFWDDAIADAWDFTAAGSVLDLGGGDGSLARAIARQHPTAACTTLERAPLTATTSAHPFTVRTVPGDLFAPLPIQDQGAIVLRRVLHDWDDDRATTILRHARAALAPGGAVLVIEALYPPDHPTRALMDLTMLVLTGGQERDAAAYAALAVAAGLRPDGQRALPPPWTLLVYR